MYEFIVNEEDYLASKADTVDQFMRLLVKHSRPGLQPVISICPMGKSSVS
ncbi:hypothetical protein KEH51_03315 [[Brevibacterium] frigoritolerans]|uniref:Uncharacterized protein n=1 Tax=Peribacillus frigoritolerans TaxID=450367 RepID=A0A941J4L3_9BACI|nr:hypothetical protein [Peribacillus frigoritolerans]